MKRSVKLRYVAAVSTALLFAAWITAGCSRPHPARNSESAASPEVPAASLALCESGPVKLTPSADVDLATVATRLKGTYRLEERTIEGALIKALAEYHFDVEPVAGATVIQGKALLLDRGNLSTMDPGASCKECQAHAAMGAFWDVTLRLESKNTVSLTMEGDYLGSYGDFRKGVHATEKALFGNFGGRYLAGKLVSPAGGNGFPDDVWDRVELSDKSFVYVACKGKYLDRYVKVSDQPPRPGGRTLAETWEMKKNDGSLLNPLPVSASR